MFVFVYSSYHLNLQIVLNTQKNPYLNQATPEKMLAKFSYPKKLLRSSPSLEIWSTPRGRSPPLHFLK